MEDKIFLGKLNDIYGEFLTENQRNVIVSYYNYDLSLSEIGNNLGISSQAVSDTKRKAEAILKKYEAKLGLLRLKEELNKLLINSDMPDNVAEKLKKISDSIGG